MRYPTTMLPPGTLPELEAIPDPTDRALAATAYIAQRQEAIETARQIRDRAILTLLQTQTQVAVARAVGMSVEHVRNVKRWMGGGHGAP
jgi:hypothetical protein